MLGLLRTIARGALSRVAVPLVTELALAVARRIRSASTEEPPAEEIARDLANAVPSQVDDHPHVTADERLEIASAVGARVEELTVPTATVDVPRSPIARENTYDPIIRRAAARFAVPGWIVKSVIATESSFRPGVYRDEPQISDRSRGLMQLLLRTARGLGFTGEPDLLYDPELNIMLGTALLAQLLKRFGTWEDALAAYNGGRPRRGTSGQLEPRLQAYVDKVMHHAGRFGVRVAVGAGGIGLLALALVFALRR